MIFWYEKIDNKPEEVNAESLKKILRTRHKMSISPSCAKFYENKHLCICPFSKETGGTSRVLMGNTFDMLIKQYNDAVNDI